MPHPLRDALRYLRRTAALATTERPVRVDCGHSRLRSPCLKPAVRVRPPRSRGLDRRPRKSSFGHRRLSGAAIAGVATAPCMVRAMTDEEARRAQIAEKLQRADMHPIEEAEGLPGLDRL
jgi:hypothetical protein